VFLDRQHPDQMARSRWLGCTRWDGGREFIGANGSFWAEISQTKKHCTNVWPSYWWRTWSPPARRTHHSFAQRSRRLVLRQRTGILC